MFIAVARGILCKDLAGPDTGQATVSEEVYMVRKSLSLGLLLALAMPLSAQEEAHVWTSHRPDGHAPFGVTGGRTLEQGAVEFSYRYAQFDSKGVWFDSDSLGLETTLEFYQVAPLTLSNKGHTVSAAFGATKELTFLVSGSWLQIERAQLTSDGVFYVTQTQGFGDVEASALFSFYNQGPIRAHVQLGGLIPTGQEATKSRTPFSSDKREPLPYDQRRGGGTFAVLPGLTVSVQNEVASVGAQIKGNISVGTNDLGYARGNMYEATGWAAYVLNDYFSVSGRVRWTTWSGIDGADPSLDPLRDPGNDGFFMDGERIDIPVGLNFYLPEGSRFAGHRLSVEGFFPVSHDYEGPQLGLDWGVVLGWQVVF